MSTLTKTRKSVKVERVVKVLSRFDEQGNGAEIEITIARGRKVETFRYWIDRLAVDFGIGFKVEKQGTGEVANEEYAVNLNGTESTCDCKGFSRWNRCKHADALAKLTELGKL